MKKKPAAKRGPADPAMARAVAAWEKSGLTLDELGQRMGYEGELARTSAWQFLRKTTDPRLSMLRRFAKAVGVPVEELVVRPGHAGRKGVNHAVVHEIPFVIWQVQILSDQSLARQVGSQPCHHCGNAVVDA